MSPEDKTNLELEAMRLQVEQEIDQFWQDEAARGQRVPEDPSEDIEPDDIADPKLYEAAVAQFKADRIHGYLNNFSCNLPGGMNRENAEKYGFIDKKLHENEENSLLMSNQTCREFYTTIDHAMEQASINQDDFKVLKEAAEKRYDNPTDSIYQTSLNRLRLEKALLSIFIRLRMMGYNKIELAQ